MEQDKINNLPEQILIDGDWETREVHIDGKFLRPDQSQKLKNHSPDGFNWGYGGSGPAQLSLAILLKYMHPEYALALYQDFKFRFVANIPQEDFEINVNLRSIISEICSARTTV